MMALNIVRSSNSTENYTSRTLPCHLQQERSRKPHLTRHSPFDIDPSAEQCSKVAGRKFNLFENDGLKNIRWPVGSRFAPQYQLPTINFREKSLYGYVSGLEEKILFSIRGHPGEYSDTLCSPLHRQILHTETRQ